MKINAAILMVMFLALSGFTWGASDDSKSTKSNDPYSTSSSNYSSSSKKKKSSYSTQSKRVSVEAPSMANASSYVPSSSPDQRAQAVRILTAGDEATRKARMESLSRIARAMAAKKQAEANQNQAQY